MSTIRRTGFRLEPPDGWPLDQLLVGAGTVRTARELFRQRSRFPYGMRAWDVWLTSTVTSQGAGKSLKRLHRLGVIEKLPPLKRDSAPCYRLDHAHPLVIPLGHLFEAERRICQ